MQAHLLIAIQIFASLASGERIEGQFLPEEFFHAIEAKVEKDPQKTAIEVRFDKRTDTFLFEPWDIAQPRFNRVYKADRIPQTLFFKTMGYNARDGQLEVPCIIYRAREIKSAHQRAMPVMLKLKMKESDGWEAIRQFERRELRIELTVTIDGVRWELRDQRQTFLLSLAAPKARLYRLKSPWLDPPAQVGHAVSIGPEAAQEKEDIAGEFAEEKQKTHLLLKAAEFQSLKLFADWQPDEKGWYARDFLDTYGNDHQIAVFHKGREGAVMWTALPQSLPAGDYQVFLLPGYTRQRVREHILKVTLNDQSHEFRWHTTSPLDTGGWIPAPVFATRKGGRLLKIQGLQVGGGGLGGIPEPPSWATILSKIFITDDLEMKTPQSFLEPEEDSK